MHRAGFWPKACRGPQLKGPHGLDLYFVAGWGELNFLIYGVGQAAGQVIVLRGGLQVEIYNRCRFMWANKSD